MVRDDVRCRIDVAQRRVQHRQRSRVVTGRELVADVADDLAQPLLVRLGLLELGDEPVDFRAV